ncbi:MAG TPA: ferrous iron transport protein B [Ignavibacteria bacterium]|nr:ferrous iron transport protein B [Ignavibacteria bacterium]
MGFTSKAQNCHDTSALAEISHKNSLPVIGLIGMPNSGKTTLFNSLTGSNYKTSNYPGATVEYSSGRIIKKSGFDAIALDSPGIISLNPNSPDEVISINGLFNHPKFGQPEIVIVTCDTTQLSRQLFLIKQVIDAGFCTVVALTMNDLLEKRHLEVDTYILSEILNIPVIKVNSKSGKGINELIDKVKELYNEISITGNYKNAQQPEIPSIDDIALLYDFTEDTERKVLKPCDKKIDIEEINRKVFELHRKPDKVTVRLDKYFLHPVLGMLIFIISMGLIFTSIFWIAQPLMDLIDSGFTSLSTSVSGILPSNTWYNDLITKGIINGFGSVMVFVPQIVILFILLGLLEDTGYLARAAMLVDKPLSKFGLNGRSFIPMLSGYACAIPAMMAARTISNRRERFLTIMIIPLMSCSARLPVYGLLLAFLVPHDKAWIAGLGMGALYLFSIISGSVVAGVISKFKKANEKSTFMLELPPYRVPVFRNILKNTYNKSLVYVKQAGPIIVIISLVLWALTYFPNYDGNVESLNSVNLTQEQTYRLVESERLNSSYAATIGKKVLEPLLTPLGWDWRIGVSLISAFAAREVFVSSMAITFAITEENEDNIQGSLLSSMREAKKPDGTTPLFTTASTISLIIYFMFAMQCLSTVVVCRKETGSWRIPLIQIGAYTFLAYILAFTAYNLLNLIGIS